MADSFLCGLCKPNTTLTSNEFENIVNVRGKKSKRILSFSLQPPPGSMAMCMPGGDHEPHLHIYCDYALQEEGRELFESILFSTFQGSPNDLRPESLPWSDCDAITVRGMHLSDPLNVNVPTSL